MFDTPCFFIGRFTVFISYMHNYYVFKFWFTYYGFKELNIPNYLLKLQIKQKGKCRVFYTPRDLLTHKVRMF